MFMRWSPSVPKSSPVQAFVRTAVGVSPSAAMVDAICRPSVAAPSTGRRYESPIVNSNRSWSEQKTVASCQFPWGT